MIARAGSGWQTIIADLALILFMVSISAVKSPAPDARPAPQPALVEADPVAIFRAAPGSQTLGQWLATQPTDPRQQLTVVAHYSEGQGEAVSAAALAMAAEAKAAGRTARIMLEPAETNDVFAVLAYDAPDGGWHAICSDAGRGSSSSAAQKEMPCR